MFRCAWQHGFHAFMHGLHEIERKAQSSGSKLKENLVASYVAGHVAKEASLWTALDRAAAHTRNPVASYEAGHVAKEASFWTVRRHTPPAVGENRITWHAGLVGKQSSRRSLTNPRAQRAHDSAHHEERYSYRARERRLFPPFRLCGTPSQRQPA